MNYVSHFLIAERDLSRVGAVCSLLPDVLQYAGARNTHRRPRTEADQASSPLWQDAIDGIEHHLAVDRAFHTSAWFEDRMQESLAWLRSEKSPLLDHWSLWLLRHVAIELVLDGTLIDADPDLCPRLYDGLDTLLADPTAIGELETEYRATPDGLQRYLGRVAEHRWLEVYAEPGGVAKAIERVFQLLLERRPRLRASHPDAVAFTEEERDALLPFLTTLRDQIRASEPDVAATLDWPAAPAP